MKTGEQLYRDAMAQLELVLTKPPSERDALLLGLAQAQPPLHALVVQLLKAEREAAVSGFLEVAALKSAPSIEPDRRLGAYRIVRKLGEGGMGQAWLARRADGLYEGDVAIKTLHPHLANTQLRERFTREAHILGKLTHKNIARLLDAGVAEDGIAYLVLEYVHGEALDAWCDARSLPIRARLELFLSVCQAVSHAHAHLVVHRDLKPSNILVTARDSGNAGNAGAIFSGRSHGVVKLLDFGVAKLVQGEDTDVAPTALTQFGGRIFTPEYAAPEQILGEPVTTATDVYALGVVLYVLLSGKRPFGRNTGTGRELEQAILHKEPAALSLLPNDNATTIASARATTPAKLQRAIAGDLEFIVACALRKSPKARYGSALALAVDIERYLQQQPIEARAGSTGYKLSRFVQRHRAATVATVVSVSALFIGLGTAVWQLKIARSERQRAEDVKEFVASIFRSADPFFTGTTAMSALDLLTLARERIDRELQAQPENATELLLIVGESQGNLEQFEAAKATFVKAIELAGRRQPRDEVAIAEARSWLATINRFQGNLAAVRPLLDQSIPVLRANQPRTARALSGALIELANINREEGDAVAAVELAREAVAAVEADLGASHSETILAKRQLGLFLVLAQRFDEARPLIEQILRDIEALFPSGERKALLMTTESLYGRMLIDSGGDLKVAIRHLTAAIDLTTELYGAKSDAVVPLLSLLSRAQARLGDMRSAAASARQAAEVDAGGLLSSRALNNLGRFTLLAGQTNESLDPLRRAIELGKQHDTEKGSWVSLAQGEYGSALALTGRFDVAERVLKDALPAARDAVMPDSLAGILNGIGLTHQLQSRWMESETVYRQALELTSSAGRSQLMRARALFGIGVAKLELGDAAEAERFLRDADKAARETFLNIMPLRADIATHLGRALHVQGNAAAALDLLATADDYWRNYDASHRSAGLAAYWQGQARLAIGAPREARADLLRAAGVLKNSPLPEDVRLAANARQAFERLKLAQ